MSDERERRVRKALDELSKLDLKLDPSLFLNREDTVKDVTANLEKFESAWGGPGSSGPPVWELLKAPFTGRLHGMEVERGLWPWGLILLRAFGAVVAPIFGLIQRVGFWHLSRSGNDARITDDGVEVFSKRKGLVAAYAWKDIAQLRRIFEPPLTFWELVLTNGEVVPMPLAEIDADAFRGRGITVHGAHKFRSEYGNDG